MSIQYTVPGFEPQPLKHESSPITTRPGLPPLYSSSSVCHFIVSLMFTFHSLYPFYPPSFAMGNGHQYDQILLFIVLWATFLSLWQQLICPNLPHSQAIFVKVLKSIIFLVKSFLGKIYRHLAIFSGHTALHVNPFLRFSLSSLRLEVMTVRSSYIQKQQTSNL